MKENKDSKNDERQKGKKKQMGENERPWNAKAFIVRRELN